MEYQDLRDWIEIADEMGELKTLKGCDWNLEIGAITELVAHKEDGPAVLFEDIKGYPTGYRVLSNSLASRKRLALTLGLPSGETKSGKTITRISNRYRRNLLSRARYSITFTKTATSICLSSQRRFGTTRTVAAISVLEASILHATRTKGG